MRRVKCPYCGATFEIPEGVEYAVCPYCGTVVEARSGSSIEASYYPIRLEEGDAYTAAVSRASQMPGVPRSFSEEASLVNAQLHVIPLYVCRIRVDCGEYSVERAEPVPAVRSPLPGLDEGYQFPAAGREPYNPGVYGRVDRFHQTSIPASMACSGLEGRLVPLLEGAALVQGCRPRGVESKVEGVAHYPFWLVEYTHPLSNRPLRAVVDAVDARVVYLEYPRSLGRRALLAAVSAGGTAAGLLLGLGVSTAAGLHGLLALLPPLSSLLATLIAVSPGFARAARSLGRYTWRSEGAWATRVRLTSLSASRASRGGS